MATSAVWAMQVNYFDAGEDRSGRESGRIFEIAQAAPKFSALSGECGFSPCWRAGGYE
jgi:hypothetical protein